MAAQMMKQPFTGFTKAEVQKMEQLLEDPKDQTLDTAFFKDLAKVFNRSSNRAGKPILKWAQIQSWFQTKQESLISEETSSNEDKAIISVKTSSDGAKELHVPDSLNQSKAAGNPIIPDQKAEERLHPSGQDDGTEEQFNKDEEVDGDGACGCLHQSLGNEKDVDSGRRGFTLIS